MSSVKRPLRVLMVGHAYVLRVNRQVLDVLAASDDIEVHVLAPDYVLSGSGKRVACEMNPTPARYHLRTSPTHLSRLRGQYYTEMPKLVREIHPDVIHLGYEPGSITALQAVRLAQRVGSKTTCFLVDNVYRTLAGEARQRLHRRDWIGAIGALVAELMERCTLPRVAYLLSCNEEARQTYHRYRGYRGPSRVIPIGTDTALFYKRNVEGLRQRLGLQDFVIGYFGRLVPEKGVHLIIEAAAQIERPFQLLIDQFVDTLENEKYLNDLRLLAERYGISHRLVFFDAPHAEMPTYMNCADCAVIPSLSTLRWKEQYGRVVAEAMACEVPVIGSQSGNIPDLIGDAGLTFPEGDVAALRDCLLLMTDTSLRLQLGRAGRERVQRNFSIQVEADIYRQSFFAVSGYLPSA